MHIHEYQAKELLRAYGIPTPQGRLARSHVEALEAARAMPGLSLIHISEPTRP